MSNRIKLVQGDTLPYIRVTLRNATGVPIDLSALDTVVRIYFREAGSTTTLSTFTCSKPTGGADGVVLFNFPEGALDLPASAYEGEIEVSFGTDKQTVYQPLKFILREQFA